jgi:hypothetical protein
LNWEYWPWQIFYIPVFFYFLWLAVKSRSLFFFFNANPGIESGGMLIESKKKILDLLPENLIPKTLFFNHPVSKDEVINALGTHSIRFPIIIKPDFGERGKRVEKIEDSVELANYLNINRLNVIIQEFINYPIELGIFYIRHPDKDNGTITSIVKKKLLVIVGDGKSNVKDLIKQNPRALLQLKDLEKRHPDLMNLIPGKNETIELVSIANHCRGTTFINGNELISESLLKVIDDIGKNIDGFYYGRFDIRCNSIEDLNDGKNFKILELNGAKSEPAHIYHPGFYLNQAYKIVFEHWNEIYTIAQINKKLGISYPSFQEGLAAWKKYRHYSKLRY